MAKCLGLLLDPRPALPALKSLPASLCSIPLCSAGFLALAANPLITQKSLLLGALFPARLYHKVLLLNTMGSTNLWLPSHSLTQLYEAADFLSQWMTPPLPAKNGVHLCLVFLTGPASSSFPEDIQWRFPNCLLPHAVGQALIIYHMGIIAGLPTMGGSKDVELS